MESPKKKMSFIVNPVRRKEKLVVEEFIYRTNLFEPKIIICLPNF